MRTFLEELAWRGMVQDTTPGFATRLERGPVVAYIGFDPTAPSLQVGNLVPVMLLAHLQRHGGTPIALVGAGTATIGDPSGRSEERPLLSLDEIDRNAQRMRDQLARFLDFDHPQRAARMLNNAEWLRPLNLVEFLRDTGKHFTISYMLQKESVRSRLDAGISYTEFTYMLLQAYDFLHLYRTEGCDVQMGGSDQWGNITAGTELIRRTGTGEAHALSAPLVTMASGAKFGKSAGNAVWLDPEMTSPYQFFQFWINTDDRDVERYLKTFTFLDAAEIADVMAGHEDQPSARGAQWTLATDLANRVHGSDATRRAAEASRVAFGDVPLREASDDAWSVLRQELPAWSTTADELPLPAVDLLARSGLTTSKGDARRQLQQGGISLNGEKIEVAREIEVADLIHGRYLWLRRGKKTDVIVDVQPSSALPHVMRRLL